MIKNFNQFNEAIGHSRPNFDFEAKIEEKNVTIYGGDKFIEGSDDTEHTDFDINWNIEIAIDNSGIQSIKSNIEKIAGTIKFIKWGDNDNETLESLDFIGEGQTFKIKDQQFNIIWNIEFQENGQYSISEIEIDLHKKTVTLS